MTYCQHCQQPTEHKVVAKYAPNGENVLMCEDCKTLKIPYTEMPITIIVIQSVFKAFYSEPYRIKAPRKLIIDKRHSHYWIKNEVLHES